MKLDVEKRYQLCVKCLTNHPEKTKTTIPLQRTEYILEVGKAKKWYNPLNHNTEICEFCPYEQSHEMYKPKQEVSILY